MWRLCVPNFVTVPLLINLLKCLISFHYTKFIKHVTCSVEVKIAFCEGGIDDIRSDKKAEAYIAVQLFNGFSHNICLSGELKPQIPVIITSHSTFCSSERNKPHCWHAQYALDTMHLPPSLNGMHEIYGRTHPHPQDHQLCHLGHSMIWCCFCTNIH